MYNGKISTNKTSLSFWVSQWLKIFHISWHKWCRDWFRWMSFISSSAPTEHLPSVHRPSLTELGLDLGLCRAVGPSECQPACCFWAPSVSCKRAPQCRWRIARHRLELHLIRRFADFQPTVFGICAGGWLHACSYCSNCPYCYKLLTLHCSSCRILPDAFREATLNTLNRLNKLNTLNTGSVFYVCYSCYRVTSLPCMVKYWMVKYWMVIYWMETEKASGKLPLWGLLPISRANI